MTKAFQTKVAIVTGAASGIGLAVAARLTADGIKVVLADLNEVAGQAAAERLGGLFVKADLSRRSDCKLVVDTALRQFGTVHILVNNAGFQHVAPIESFPEDTWDKMIAVMLTAPFLLTRYVWPAMKKQQWGRIINISSIHGQVASPFKAAYISAKHGVIGLTRTAALEGGEFGITVNAIAPAYVRTPLVENQIADQAKANNMAPQSVVREIMLAPAAVKRLIEPSEIGNLVAFLTAEQAGAITGAVHNIDLGWTAR